MILYNNKLYILLLYIIYPQSPLTMNPNLPIFAYFHDKDAKSPQAHGLTWQQTQEALEEGGLKASNNLFGVSFRLLLHYTWSFYNGIPPNFPNRIDDPRQIDHEKLYNAVVAAHYPS